jgi:hypothetical protein
LPIAISKRSIAEPSSFLNALTMAPGSISTAWRPACWFSQAAALAQYGGIWT